MIDIPTKPGQARNSVLADLMRTCGTVDSLLHVLATIAKDAGREDLHSDLTKRIFNHSTPPDAVTHHKSGCLFVREGKLSDAEIEFRKAIRVDPGFADAHGNLGVALGQLRRLPEAEAAFRLAVRLDPAVVTVYVNLATCLLQQAKYPEVETWARQAIQLNPDLAEPHRLLGCSLDARRKYEAAEAALNEAVRLDPKNADAHFRLGTVLARRDKLKEAEAALREAVKVRPAHAGAWSALGGVLLTLDRSGEAADAAREAVRHDSVSADLLNSYGVALAACERHADAEAAYREAVRLDPKVAAAHSNLGNALRSLGRADEAEASLREALRLKPDYPEAHNNLGIVLVQLGRDDEGMREYDAAIRLAPDYPEARMNRSLAWLGNGEFEKGWPEYEWRWKVKPFKLKAEPGPRWDGADLAGKTLLLCAEQGLGDAVQFVRYAAAAKARGATVVVDCPVPLAGLAATCPGVDQVVPRGQPLPAFDAQAPMMSLPGLLGVPPAAACAAVPYFTPDAGRVAHWKDALADVPGLKVGIAWQGSKAHKGDRLRSVPLTRFAPLAAVPGVTLCSLQKGPGSEQLADGAGKELGVVDFGGRTAADLGDVAALMMSLDVVVAVDTAVVHLAGALSRPVWVALPFAPDWRWLREGDSTAWYPTMRLFRQTTRGDWDALFGRIAVALAAAARAKAEGRTNAESAGE